MRHISINLNSLTICLFLLSFLYELTYIGLVGAILCLFWLVKELVNSKEVEFNGGVGRAGQEG